MPKIEISRAALTTAIGASAITDDELEAIFPAAKAELDEPAGDDGFMKVELNDTNRPDLWSTAGLARQLRLYRGAEPPQYDFFSNAATQRETGSRRVVVDRSVGDIRPYLAGFVMTGPPLSEVVLKDLIQTQEKLTWNFGRKRRSISMGIYRSDLIEYPVHYKAVDPDSTRFVPLQMERELSMRQMLTEHPKGVEFGHIVAELPRFPILTDDRGGILSFPPVINSATIGAVVEGDTTLFVELTGSDLDSLLLTASIVACDAADMGYAIEPVRIEYPYDTPYGREITVPYYFQTGRDAAMSEINAMLGVDLSRSEVTEALRRMGIEVTEPTSPSDVEHVSIRVPEYRNDFLHAVDVVEEVMIGRGMESFVAEMPRDFTVGRLLPIEEFSRRAKTVMVGLGFQEMIFNYLGSGRDFVERMYPEDEWTEALSHVVRIANPMSENYEFVRPSILPSLLAAESVSGNAVYPHHVFEVGKIACRAENEASGTRTLTKLGFVSADRGAGFNLVNSHISAILYYLGHEYTVREVHDSRFIPGRAAQIVRAGSENVVGVFGEVHPRVLDAWGIQMPCTGGEVDLEVLIHGDDGDAGAS